VERSNKIIDESAEKITRGLPVFSSETARTFIVSPVRRDAEQILP
jgi:hypothetical protein